MKNESYFIDEVVRLDQGSNVSKDYLDRLVNSRQRHSGNQWSKFIRTRNELEHILKIRYDSIKHSYSDVPEVGEPEITGLEIILHRAKIKDTGNANQAGKVAYAEYIELRPCTSQGTEINRDKRYVVSKEVMKDYLVHTDEVLHLKGNPQRAYAIEFYIGEDPNDEYVVVMQHVNHRIEIFICGESHNPVRIPTESFI